MSWRMAAWLPPLYSVALYGGAWGVLAVFWAQHGWRAAQQAGRSGRGVSEFILALDAAEDNTFFACVLPWVLLLVMVFSSAVKLSLRDPEGVLQQARAVGELGVQDEVLQGFTNVTTKTMLAAVSSATTRRVSESLLLRGVRRSVLLLPPLLIAAHRLLYLPFTRRLWPREQLGLAMAIVQYVAMTLSMALSWREMTEIVLFLGEQSARMAVFSIMFEQRGAAAAGLPWINNGKPNNLRLWMQIRTHLLRANCIMLRWIEGSSAMILLCGLAALVLLAVTLLQGSLFSSTRGSTDLQIALSWAILGFITLIVMEFLVVVVAVSIGTTNIADLRRLSRAAWDLEATLSAMRWPGVFGPLPPPGQLGGGSGRRPVPAAWHGSYGGGSGAHAMTTMTHGHGCWDTRLQAHEAASPVQSLVAASSPDQTSAAVVQQQQPQQLRQLQHGHQRAAAAGDGHVSAPLGLPIASGRAASLDVFAPSVAALPSGGHAAGGSRQGSARRSQIGSCRVSGGGGNATKAAAELPLPISLPHQATATELCAAAPEGGRSNSGTMGPEAADGTQQATSGGGGVQSAVGLSSQQPRAAAGAVCESAEQGLVASAPHVPAGAAPATAGECGSKGGGIGIRQGGLLDHFSGSAEAARANVAVDSEAAAALLRPQPPAPPPSLEELETCRLLLLRLIDVLRHSEEYLELFGVPLEPKFRSSLLSFVLTLAAAGLSAVISFLAKR